MASGELVRAWREGCGEGCWSGELGLTESAHVLRNELFRLLLRHHPGLRTRSLHLATRARGRSRPLGASEHSGKQSGDATDTDLSESSVGAEEALLRLEWSERRLQSVLKLGLEWSRRRLQSVLKLRQRHRQPSPRRLAADAARNFRDEGDAPAEEAVSVIILGKQRARQAEPEPLP